MGEVSKQEGQGTAIGYGVMVIWYTAAASLSIWMICVVAGFFRRTTIQSQGGNPSTIH
jgi:hypothetical protein